MSEILERRYVPKGKIVVRAGDPGNSAFLIQSGIVRVYVEHQGKQVELARLGAGQIFGEMALVFDEKRTATVEAAEDANLIVITRAILEEKLHKSDPTVRAIVPMLMKRIVQNNNSLLSHHADLRMLADVAMNIYNSILGALPETDQPSFKDDVLPKLDDFLIAVRSFEEKYTKK